MFLMTMIPPRLHTHGIPVRIEWGKFKVGTSFFVPGVDQAWLGNEIRKETNRMGFEVKIRQVAEGGMLGIRVLRIG